MSSSCFLLTQCLHQKLNEGRVACQGWTHSRVDAHVRQHPDQLHQHIVILLCVHGRFAGGRDACLSSLVAVVQSEERVHAALALVELLLGLLAFGREVPEGEKEAHDEVLWETSG